MNPAVPLVGALFAAVGLVLLWRAWSRRGWVTLRGTVIAHSPATGMVSLALADADPPRFGSIAWPHRSQPLPGSSLHVTHPPGAPGAIRLHRHRIADVAGGLVFLAGGIATLILGR